MKRNRSVRALPLDKLNLLKHPLPENNYSEKLYFGEEVLKGVPPIFDKSQFLSSDDSDILISVRDVGSKSSSSSLSWGEECKSEASKKLREELERMDRVLRGVEPIPDNYDKEEYEEWMHLFPNLCVVGTGITCTNAVEESCHEEEILEIHPEVSCDTTFESSEIKNAVIDKMYDKMASSAPKIALNDPIDVDSFLKVSAVGTSRFPRRQSSSRSLISSQISSSKWLKDEDYDSLPFLVGGRKPGAPKSILKNSLVLPPIEGSQFRSVSATPRRESKTLSAMSMKDQKYSGFKRKNV